MIKRYKRLGMAGVCILSILMLVSCGDTPDSTGGTSTVETISVDAPAENVQFVIRKEEEPGDEKSVVVTEKIHLLVAIDNSGSMGPSGKVIQETIEMISVLVKDLLPESSVEYLLFNANRAEFVSADNLNSIGYGGQTSIYLGMEKINAWVEEQVQSNRDQGIRTGLILFSDLFSSRTKDGPTSKYDEETAKEEQEDIDKWVSKWNDSVKDGDLDVCVIQWESMTEGEDSSLTLDQPLDTYTEGFQVKLEPLGNNLLELGDVGLEKDGHNIQIEQDVFGKCLAGVLGVITGVEKQEWSDMGKIERWNNPLIFRIKAGYKLVIRIDSTEPESNVFHLSYSETKEEYPVQHIFCGKVTDVYIAGNVPADKLEILADNPKSQHVYYLTIPQIKMEAKFKKSGGRVEVGEDITINIVAECREDDIRWRDTSLPLNICVEIEDRDQRCMVYEEAFSVMHGDNLVLTPRTIGNFKVVVYYTDSFGSKTEIGRNILNVE